MTAIDILFMQQAIALARRGQGRVSPNPLVGAVVVRGGRIVAEGWHRHYGGLHAEAMALKNAGELARDATLYCTLEPCCFRTPQKKQPPCGEFILAAGLRRVLIANLDPNPLVSGRGVAQLRQAGLEVVTGVESEAAAMLNQGFFHRQRYQRPFIRLKMAQSLDGCLACNNGQSRWLTDVEARQIAHRLRAESDAILVGRRTALADDPQLSVRLAGRAETCPLRVVLDRQLRLPTTLKLFNDRWREKTLLVCDHQQAAGQLCWYRQQGVQILTLPTPQSGSDSSAAQLDYLLAQLASTFACNSLMVEGGAKLMASLVHARRYDQVLFFNAPLILGGQSSVATLPWQHVSEAPRLKLGHYQTIGDQLLYNAWRQAPLVPGGSVSGSWPAVSNCNSSN